MALIPIGYRKGVVYAEVDAADVPLVSQYRWCIKMGYAATMVAKGVDQPHATMHRLIMGIAFGAAQGLQVDHIDGNPLNNKRSNLRICTRSQNQMNKGVMRNNKTGLKGVSYCPNSDCRKKYRAAICANGKNIYLGMHATAEEAHAAYVAAAKIYHGEFAYRGEQRVHSGSA